MKKCKNCDGIDLHLDETCPECGRDQHQKNKPEVTFGKIVYVPCSKEIREVLNEHCAFEGRDENVICLDALTELVAATEMEQHIKEFFEKVIEQIDEECMITFHRPVPKM